jgi:hypothetical protein
MRTTRCWPATRHCGSTGCSAVGGRSRSLRNLRLLRAAQEVILQSAVGTAGTRRLDRGDSVARVRVTRGVARCRGPGARRALRVGARPAGNAAGATSPFLPSVASPPVGRRRPTWRGSLIGLTDRFENCRSRPAGPGAGSGPSPDRPPAQPARCPRGPGLHQLVGLPGPLFRGGATGRRLAQGMVAPDALPVQSHTE